MSADPWLHEYLKARVERHVAAWQGQEVIVHRFMQRDVRGLLLRGDEARGLIVVAGHGTIPVDLIDTIEAAAS